MLARTEIANEVAGFAPAIRRAALLIEITKQKPDVTSDAANLARHCRISGPIGEINDKKNAYRRIPPGGNSGRDRRRKKS